MNQEMNLSFLLKPFKSGILYLFHPTFLIMRNIPIFRDLVICFFILIIRGKQAISVLLVNTI